MGWPWEPLFTSESSRTSMYQFKRLCSLWMKRIFFHTTSYSKLFLWRKKESLDLLIYFKTIVFEEELSVMVAIWASWKSIGLFFKITFAFLQTSDALLAFWLLKKTGCPWPWVSWKVSFGLIRSRCMKCKCIHTGGEKEAGNCSILSTLSSCLSPHPFLSCLWVLPVSFLPSYPS